MIPKLRRRVARLLVGRFATLPETKPDETLVLIVTDAGTIILKPDRFRIRSRSVPPAMFDTSDYTFDARRWRSVTTFAGVIKR